MLTTQAIFKVLTENGLVINHGRCVFGKRTFNFLGHTVSKTPPADRVDCILRIQELDSVKVLQESLGAINFYHRFIPHAAEMLRPLHAVLHGSPRKLKWGCEQSTTFWNAKQPASISSLMENGSHLPSSPESYNRVISSIMHST